MRSTCPPLFRGGFRAGRRYHRRRWGDARCRRQSAPCDCSPSPGVQTLLTRNADLHGREIRHAPMSSQATRSCFAPSRVADYLVSSDRPLQARIGFLQPCRLPLDRYGFARTVPWHWTSGRFRIAIRSSHRTILDRRYRKGASLWRKVPRAPSTTGLWIPSPARFPARWFRRCIRKGRSGKGNAWVR